MPRISFAPELSATLRRVSCWITLLGLLHDLEQAPALLLRDGARFCYPDEVAHTALVLLVVDLELGALLDGLAVQAVGLGRADLDDDRLVHLLGYQRAKPGLAVPPRAGVGLSACGGGLGNRGQCLGLGCGGEDAEVPLAKDGHDPRDVVPDLGDLAR